MSAFTNYAEDKIIKALFGNTNLATLGNNIYVALFTAVTDGEAGTVTEVSGSGYTRKQVNAVSWDTTTVVGEAKNLASVDYGTAGASWGTVTHVGFYDASSAGNLWMVGALTLPRTVNTGDPVSFAVGTLVFKVL